MSATVSGCPSRSARRTAAGSSASQARRLAIPVSASVRASIARHRTSARRSISPPTSAAMSASASRCSICHTRGVESVAQRLPSTCPDGAKIGKPAYAMTSRSAIAGFERSTGSSRASSTTSGAPLATTCWQKECDSGVSRASAHGCAMPHRPAKIWRSSVTTETSAVGASATRAAMRAKRSKIGCGAPPSPSALSAWRRSPSRTAALRRALDTTGGAVRTARTLGGSSMDICPPIGAAGPGLEWQTEDFSTV